ncbi:MAG: lytic transglycosylase domain-containing protein, partial [Gammaproteobacteria bacterium]|nr:lytic transglycosylase domain-containing protein [Gammaproteobacteria bacterium]
HWNDYEVRFPTPFRELVFNHANVHGINPSLIYGVVRRESAYRPNARSNVGALGLMQLMPDTARLESKLLGRERPTYKEILNAENNILLGSSYLNRMLERFGGNQALAAAAYNAGPKRVDSWLPETNPVSSDIWIDTLPFKETREYVRAVLAYSTIFEWKLDQKITTISSRINDVISKDALTALNSVN